MKTTANANVNANSGDHSKEPSANRKGPAILRFIKRHFTQRHLIKLARLSPIALVLLCVVFVYLDFHQFLKPTPESLDAAMNQYLLAARMPSIAVAYLEDNGKVVTKGVGFADIENKQRATPDTLYQVASLSKLVTAAAVMRLVEQGKLGLDADINDSLPFSVRNPTWPNTPITVRMLLTHTGSLVDGPAYWESYTIGVSPDPTISLGDFLKRCLVPSGPNYSASKNFDTAKPGTNYIYDNVGFGLLAFIVEQTANESFDHFCKHEIFDRLGMASTRWFNRDVHSKNRAMPYHYSAITRRFNPIGYYGFATIADGMLKTSANDFIRFLAPFANNGMSLDGSPFLKSETVHEMLKIQYRQKGGVNQGLAWHIGDDGTAFHSGSDPGVSTHAAVFPHQGTGYLIFSNCGGSDSWRCIRGFEWLSERLGKRLTKLTEQ